MFCRRCLAAAYHTVYKNTCGVKALGSKEKQAKESRQGQFHHPVSAQAQIGKPFEGRKTKQAAVQSTTFWPRLRPLTSILGPSFAFCNGFHTR